MFIVVLIVFGLCWLPYHAYFIYNYYADLASQVSSHWSTQQYILGPDWSSPQPHSQHVFLAFFWLAMANSAVNPIIYFLMNAKCVSRGGMSELLS